MLFKKSALFVILLLPRNDNKPILYGLIIYQCSGIKFVNVRILSFINLIWYEIKQLGLHRRRKGEGKNDTGNIC